MLALMAYLVLIAALLGSAAFAIEHWLTGPGLARRGIWFGALALSIVLPALATLVSSGSAESSRAPARPEPAITGAPVAADDAWLDAAVDDAAVEGPIVLDPIEAATDPQLQDWIRQGLAALRVLDRPLILLWIASSATMLLVCLFAALALHVTSRGWRSVRFGTGELLVSDSIGPAMFGLLRPRIVVPEWLLEASAPLQALAVRHEREHAASRDQWLLAAALLLIAAAPWNPVLWWQLRRLRVAVEIDCDARVVQGGADARSYSEMLLAVRQRRATTPLGAVALTEPVSLLEQRISLLLGPRKPRHAGSRAAAGILAAAVVAASVLIGPPSLGQPADTELPLIPAGQPPGSMLNLREERLLILVDVSASMVDRTVDGIERAQSLGDAARRATAKWQQLADAVGGILARMPPGAEYQIIAFNDVVRFVVPGTDNLWLSAEDRRAMGGAVRTLREEFTPTGPKNLGIAMAAASALDPLPDSIYLVTDGLPTGENEAEQSNRLTSALGAAPTDARISVILLPHDGSQTAASAYWSLALSTGGYVAAPAADARGYEAIFSLPAESDHVIFVIDTSGSMRRFQWDRLLNQIAVTLQAHPELEGLQVLNDEGAPLMIGSAGTWLPNTPASLSDILEHVQDWQPFSNSSPRRGILQAIDDFYDPAKNISLYVLSDDLSSGESAINDVIRAVDASNTIDADGERRVRINTVAFPTYYEATDSLGTGGTYAMLARELAQRNGGVFLALPARVDATASDGQSR